MEQRQYIIDKGRSLIDERFDKYFNFFAITNRPLDQKGKLKPFFLTKFDLIQ